MIDFTYGDGSVDWGDIGGSTADNGELQENFHALKGYKDIYDIDTTLEQTDIRKDADTPTGIKPETDFVDKYTNQMAKTTASGSTTDDRTITHNEDSTADLIAKIDELEKMQSLLIEEYTNKFNDLFIQFI